MANRMESALEFQKDYRGMIKLYDEKKVELKELENKYNELKKLVAEGQPES